MTKKPERLHPDDMMAISVCLTFQAKLNPDDDDPPPIPAPEIEETFRAADATEFLEQVIDAIRARCLFGFLMQQQAQCAVGAGQWVEKTIEEIIAEAKAENVVARIPNLQKIKLRYDD